MNMPKPGEPGHNESGLLHAICGACQSALKPVEIPLRIVTAPVSPCCWCGKEAPEHYYVQALAQMVHGGTVAA
jgi:hypothetical protein